MIIILCLATVFNCGSDKAKVGEGAPFSSIDPQPTAEELYSAMNVGISEATGGDYVFYRPELTTGALSPIRAQSASSSDEWSCSLGGKITQLTSYSVSGSSYRATITTDFKDCVILMTLRGTDYQETLSGDATVNGTTQLGGSVSANLGRAISASGDLGFALNCDMTASGSLDSPQDASYSGSCTFLDSEGTKLTIDAASLN